MSQTYKPAKDQDRETIHSAGNEVSTKSLSSISEAATPHTSAGTISFLDVLPRELRDAVYDYTFEHVVRRKPDTDDDVTFHFHAPVSNLRLVSRQFTAEYDERYKAFSLRNPSLTIVNDSQDCRRNWYLEVPRLATRCTELKTIRTLFDGRDEHTELAQRDILQKFLTNFHNTAVLVKRMPRLRRVEMRFNFESLHHSDYLEELLRLFSRLALFRSWPVEGKYELRYEGLTYPQPDRLLELGVPNIGILDAPVTLASWNQASLTELIDRRELEQRLRVEAAVLGAWKAKHGCSLWESKRSLRETG
jgi:hypothetical protein